MDTTPAETKKHQDALADAFEFLRDSGLRNVDPHLAAAQQVLLDMVVKVGDRLDFCAKHNRTQLPFGCEGCVDERAEHRENAARDREADRRNEEEWLREAVLP